MNNLKSERARLNMSQNELAEKLGVNPLTVRRWETDISQCTAKHIFNMTELFGCTADYLIGRTEERV